MMRLYSTGPYLRGGGGGPFGAPLTDAARWADRAGLDGMLIFTDNVSVDPWPVAQYMIERTERLTPLVAVQPLYTHPYMAARQVSAIGMLHGRRVDLNLVTGSYKPDLRAMGCTLSHDERYERLLAYGRIMAALLRGDDALTFRSKHYQLADAVIHPTLPPGLTPGVFVAGSSAACIAVARQLHAAHLRNLPQPGEMVAPPVPDSAVRVGIIARDTSDEAWRVARARFPVHRARQRLRESHKASFETAWDGDAGGDLGPYWNHPAQVTRGEYGPYLVGSHAEVAAALLPHNRAGVTTVVMNRAVTEDDLHHAMTVMRLIRTATGEQAVGTIGSDSEKREAGSHS